MKLTLAQKKKIYLLGVRTRITQLEEELAALRGLETTKRTATAKSVPAKKPMTVAARKAVAQRMKTYWQQRKKSAKGGTT